MMTTTMRMMMTMMSDNGSCRRHATTRPFNSEVNKVVIALRLGFHYPCDHFYSFCRQDKMKEISTSPNESLTRQFLYSVGQ
jgi:hypothetical protein